jgi:hypothetical protein
MTYDWRYWLAAAAAARGAGPAARRRLANSAGVTSSGFAFVVIFPLPFPAAADCFAISVVIAERLPVFPEARVSSSMMVQTMLVDVESSTEMVGAGVTFLRFSGDARGLILCFAPFCEDRGLSFDSGNPWCVVL